LYPKWVESAAQDVAVARAAILNRDLAILGQRMEHSTHKMHATMIASDPTIRYWKPASLAVMERVEALRGQGFQCWFTLDAGPNVKILCPAAEAKKIAAQIQPLVSKVHILRAGLGARIV